VRIDLVTTSTDNRRVIARRLRRPMLGLLLTAATVSAAVLPPSHIHLVSDDHDHHHAAAIEHAHWAGHFQAELAFDDNDHDGRALFVDHPARVPAARADIPRPPIAIIALFTLPIPAAVTAEGQRDSGNAPRDGPPRGLSLLRAPPIKPAA
jgi:hypothetical protein